MFSLTITLYDDNDGNDDDDVVVVDDVVAVVVVVVCGQLLRLVDQLEEIGINGRISFSFISEMTTVALPQLPDVSQKGKHATAFEAEISAA